MLYLTGNPCKLLRAVRVTLQDCFLCILKKSFVIAEMGWYILWLFLSWCSFHGTSHLVLVDEIRSWFISWNQFHSVLQQHPLQDQAECHFGEWFVLLRARTHFPCTVPTLVSLSYLPSEKSLLAWKACIGSHGEASCHWCRWQQQSFSHSVLLTDLEIVRICQEALQNSLLQLQQL